MSKPETEHAHYQEFVIKLMRWSLGPQAGETQDIHIGVLIFNLLSLIIHLVLFRLHKNYTKRHQHHYQSLLYRSSKCPGHYHLGSNANHHVSLLIDCAVGWIIIFTHSQSDNGSTNLHICCPCFSKSLIKGTVMFSCKYRVGQKYARFLLQFNWVHIHFRMV